MPSNSRIHQDSALSDLSVAYRNDRYIADALVPAMPVNHESDSFYVYSKDNLRDEQSLWAKGARAARVDFAVSTASYQLERHALEELVLDDDRKNADPAIRLDMDATENLTEKILLEKEKTLATLVGTAANWANLTSLTSTFAWSAATSLSNPILFVDSASSVIAQNSGKLPNVMAIDHRTFMAAKEHPSITDRVKYTSPDSITAPMLAKLFNIERLLVAGAIETTGQEGLTDSMSFVWTDLAFIAYMEQNPGLKKVSAMYRFEQRSEGRPFSVFRYREDETEGDVIRVKSKYQQKVVASDCAYLINNTVQ